MLKPNTTTGQRKRWTHSLSGLEASHRPEAIIGIEHRSAMKFTIAVKLLLSAMFGFRRSLVVVCREEVGSF